MKRFLVFVIICIVTLSLGLTTYYFLRDNEVILITDSYFELNVLETFAVSVEHINKNPNTKINFESLHPEIVEYNPVTELFEAKSGGRAIVRVTSTKSDFKPVTIEVVVGDGTSNAPFFIRSIEDLLFIGKEIVYSKTNVAKPNVQTLDKNYKLRADLDFSTLTSLDPVLMENNSIPTTIYQNGIWLPIGYDKAVGEAFSGKFDFDGHVISNMTINEEQFEEDVTINYAGLFATLEANAIVTNLNLTNVEISGSYIAAGAVVGLNHGTVERTSVNSGTIFNTSLTGYAGGIVGKQEVVSTILPTVEMVYSNTTVNATYAAGGLVGHNFGGIVVSAYTNANVIGEVNTIIGGIVGVNEFKQLESATYDAIIKDTYYYGIITSESTQLGAIIGQNINYDLLTKLNRIRGNYYSTELSGEIEAIGGLLNSEINTEEIGVYNKTLSQLRQQANYYSYKYDQPGDEIVNVYWSFTKTWTLNADINNGLPVLNMTSPKINHNFAIITMDSSIQDLQDLINIGNDMSGVYVLEADLDLSLMTDDWIPIGYSVQEGITPFTGTFMAAINPETQKPFVIRNLFITSTRPVAGLFAQIGSQGRVFNLHFENVNIAAGHTTGTVAAINDGIIENVTVISSEQLHFLTSGNDAGPSTVGGIVGINNSTISNVFTDVKINLNSAVGRQGNAGGIVGINNGSINDSRSQSKLFGPGQNGQYIGGITGSNMGDIERVSHNGDITANIDSNKVFVGGIAGHLDVYGTIKYSAALGGTYQGYGVGGLVAVSRGNVQESYVEGVNLKARYAGGLAYNISEGTYSNTYTLAFISGINSNSVKAGFAYFIEYHSSSRYGTVEHSFSAVSFDSIGTNYAETAAPVRTAYQGLVPRQAGYIKNSIYDAITQSLKEQNFVSLFNTEFLIDEKDRQIKVSTEHATGTDGKAFEKFHAVGFDNTIWDFTVGYYPQLTNAITSQ